MSFYAFQTAQRLKTDALELGGEPSDGSSQYSDDRVYEFLSSTQSTLISGGAFGMEEFLPISWPWARKYPRGTIQLVQPYNGSFTNVATFTQNSKTVTLATPFGSTDPNITNWRLWCESQVTTQRPYIEAVKPTTLTLKDPWTDVTQSTPRWMAFQAEYDAPADFVRFASPIFVTGWPYRIDIVEPWQLEKAYPFSLIGPAVPALGAVVAQGPPIGMSSALGGGAESVQKIRFSHFLGTTTQGAPANTNLQLEFEYVFRPEPLDEGSIPIVPLEHRRILSLGAAYLIWENKSDQTERGAMWMRFKSAYHAMVSEHRRNLGNASSRWGVVIPRTVDEPRRLRTESGLIVW